jgi:hypothetical protein
VRRIHFDTVRQPEQLAVETVVEHPGHLRRCVALRAGQVRTPDIADEQRIPGQDFLGFLGHRVINHHYGNTLWGVSRRFEHAQRDVAEVELITIVHGAVREGGAGTVAEHNVRPGACREFPMAAHKIGVQMRFNNVCDLETLGRGFLEILLDIALGIHHSRFTVSPNQVGRVCQTSQIKLLKIHAASPCLVSTSLDA